MKRRSSKTPRMSPDCRVQKKFGDWENFSMDYTRENFMELVLISEV